MTDRFRHTTYLVRKKLFKLFGEGFHIFDGNGQLVFYSQLKAFRLKEDIRLYTGEDMMTEVLTIKARSILDFSTAYDVFDSAANEKIGTLKRKGLKSIFKDEWIVMDAHDREIGLIKEDNLAYALLRRFLSNLIPQQYVAEVQGQTVCALHQHFNPFILKMTVDFSSNTRDLLDKRLGIAASLLLCAIEGRQD